MKRAILTCFHKYTPFGGEYYEPILDFYLKQMEKYKDEFDKVYLLDSNWGIGSVPEWAEVIRVDPALRYYDAYKKVLPQIKEDLVLFLDNDMVIYRKEVIGRIFSRLDTHPHYPDEKVEDGVDIVSIFDTIGKNAFKELGGKSKFCPYLFATRRLTLTLSYLDCDWGPNMPEYETLGKLTELMLKEKPRIHEMEEDKSNFLFGEELGDKKSKDLGYYHIRSGSVPAYLLATKKYGDQKTYWDYLNHQPKTEYLRQMAWYQYMGGDAGEITVDLGLSYQDFWVQYFTSFKTFHGL